MKPCLRFYIPLDNSDGYNNMFGNTYQPPVFNGNIGGLMLEVQANTSRVFCTMHRGVVETAFARDYQWQLTAVRQAAEQQYLEPYGKNPCPQTPLLAAIMYHFAQAREEVFGLPVFVTLSSLFS